MARRRDQMTRMKKNRRFRRIRFCILVALFIITVTFGYKLVDRNKNDSASADNLTTNEETTAGDTSKEEVDNSYLLVPGEEHKELGEIESIIEYGDKGLIGVHYPVFDKTNIDQTNRDLVNKYIEEFKNEIKNNSPDDKEGKYELNIDYETYSAPNNIVSINFNITENSSYMAHPDAKIETKIYDLTNDKEVRLDSIMDGEYLDYISSLSEEHFRADETYKDSIDSSLFEEGIYPSVENYSNFILKEKMIVFTFDKYQIFSGNFGMPSIEIPYSDLEDYIKPNLQRVFTSEEDPIQVDIDLEEELAAEISLPERVLDPEKPMIALTFDDGPNKKTTIPILDALKEHDSVATFFILGNRVSSNVDILERMLEEGSEIGNHSFSHKELTKLGPDQVREQIVSTQNAVIDSTGIQPKLMRPTYGSYDDNLKSMVDMPLILWSIDTLDWQSRDAKKVTDHVLANVKDGDIILMHDIYDSTVAAVEAMLPELIDRGYQLVTVSELFEARGKKLQGGEIYNQIRER